MLERLLALLERLVDAVEVIASNMSAGTDAPRTAATSTKTEATETDTSAEDAKKAEAKKKRDEAAAKKKADAEAAAKAAAEDPLGGSDPLAGNGEKKTYKEKDVRDILAKVIDKEGRAAAFEILAKQGGGAKAFTDLKADKYEDVYVECEQRLAD